jgi:hypothetical protein
MAIQSVNQNDVPIRYCTKCQDQSSRGAPREARFTVGTNVETAISESRQWKADRGRSAPPKRSYESGRTFAKCA